MLKKDLAVKKEKIQKRLSELFKHYQRCQSNSWDTRVIWEPLDDLIDNTFNGDTYADRGFPCEKLQSGIEKLRNDFPGILKSSDPSRITTSRKKALAEYEALEAFVKITG